ncbi:(ZYRO0B06534g) [Zygosaccharomyces parabailii]|nr:(ZYRO0B06534g) [Zygosaccharomyces parabailii]CDH15301.1 uncharacterized protein ZBAI_07088 [Zygosaccharomyces bailii ISA1307]
MTVPCTAIKSDLARLSKGKPPDARLRIRKYMQRAGFALNNVTDWPPIATSILSLDTELLLHLLDMNQLSMPTFFISQPAPAAKQPTRTLKSFPSFCSRLKRSFFRGCHKFQRPCGMTLDSNADLNEKWEFDDSNMSSDDEEMDESYQPASTQTVIRNEMPFIYTSPGLPAEPNPTTNILNFI